MSVCEQSNITTETFVSDYHCKFPDYVPPKDNNRLWVHDLLHAILGTSTQSAVGEEITSIYQAVLLRDDCVDLRNKVHQDYRRDVTFDVVQNSILPGVRTFVASLGRRYGFETKSSLSVEAAATHFERAQILRVVMMREFGHREFGAVPIAELKAMPISIYQRLIKELDAPRGSGRNYTAGAAQAPAM